MLLHAMSTKLVEVPLGSEVVYDILIQLPGQEDPMKVSSATDVTVYLLPPEEEDVMFGRIEDIRALRFSDHQGEVNELVFAHAPIVFVACATSRSITEQRAKNAAYVRRGQVAEERALAEND